MIVMIVWSDYYDFDQKTMSLNNPMLKRFWFFTSPATGFGVTAFSLEDARYLLRQVYSNDQLDEIKGVIEDIDISEIKANHVLRNMGPTNFRGIWYPRLNLY